MQILINIDVNDAKHAIAPYTAAFELQLGRRLEPGFVELVGGSSPIYLLIQPAGTAASPNGDGLRHYGRHWCPIHLDFVVEDINQAVTRAVRAGAVVEKAPFEEPYGYLALLSDPFGHGFCFIQFTGAGYG